MAFADPLTTAAVLEVCDRTAASEGLGFDRASVVAVMAAPQEAAAAALLVRCARDLVVLNADVPTVAELAPNSGAERLLWVSRDTQNDRVRDHIAAGGAAIVSDEAAEDAALVLWADGAPHRVCELGCLSAEARSAEAEIRAYAAALAYGLRLPVTAITSSLTVLRRC
jgi:hypothetical protein